MTTDSPTQEKGDFLLFLEAAERHDPIASARGCEELSPGDRTLLERFAKGDCAPDERSRATNLLVMNWEAMEFLAATVKDEDYVPVGSY